MDQLQGGRSEDGSHGVSFGNLVGYTREDSGDRADDIAEWLSRKSTDHITQWVVIDDEPEGMIACRDPGRLVRTDGNYGLTAEDADRAIEILNANG